MHRTLRRLFAPLSSPLLALGLAMAASPARADLFEIDWGYRWSLGWLHHETGHPDLDPADHRYFYRDVIKDFHFDVSDIGNFRDVVGSGGDITVEYTPFTCDLYPLPCWETEMTFDLGPVFASQGDASDYALKLHFESPGSPWAPLPRLDQEDVWTVDGALVGDNGNSYVAMSRAFGTSNMRIATPVPEPAALALFGAGLALVGLGARRRG